MSKPRSASAFSGAAALALLAVALLSAASPSAAREVDLDQVDPAARKAAARRNVSLLTVEDGPTSVVLRLENANLPDKKNFPYKIQRFVALPPEGLPRIVDLGSKYRLIDYRDNIYHYPSAEPGAPKAALPADLAEFATVRELGRFRDYRLGSLEIDLVKRQEVTKQRYDHLRLDEATFALVYPEPVPPGDPVRLENLLEREFFRDLVVNPAMPPLLDPSEGMGDFAEQGPWIELMKRGAVRGGMFKMMAYEPGLHAFSGVELAEAGLDLARANPADLRLYYRGREIPFQATASGRSIKPEDKFAFHAPGEPGERYAEAFWLFENARPLAETPPLRIEPEPEAAPASAKPWKSALVETRRWAERLLYERKLRSEDDFSRWFWIEAEMGETRSVEFDIGPEPPSGGPATLTVEAAVPSRTGRLLLRFYVNGLLAGDEEIAKSENRRFSFQVPATYFRAGTNEIAMAVEGSDPARGRDRVLLKGFSLDLSRAPEASPPGGATMRLERPIPAQGSAALLQGPAGWASLACRWDVSEPLRPKALAPAKGSAPGTFLLEPGTSRIALAGWESARPVGAITKRPAPSVADRSRGGNYVIVHHRLFEAGARRLANYRGRQRGIVPRLLDVEEMYDAFDYGRPGSQALAEGLRYAYRFWPDPKPFYVTLIGEASEWTGDPATLPAEAVPNFVPVYKIDEAKDSLLRGDHRYGLLRDGDRFPSLVMARLPVSTPEQLDGMLDKIERYESGGEVGPWQLLNVFVADDEPEFGAAARHVIAYALNKAARSYLLDQGEFPYRSLPHVPGAKQAQAATDLLVEIFNKGAFAINFFGHGGPNIWTHEKLLHLSDLPKLHNLKTPSLLTCSSCDNAWLDYPLPPVSASMGERLATMPEGGAIAVFAPTAGGFTSDHRVLIESLYEGIFHRDLRKIGDATFHARLSYIEETGRTNITDQFVLLGDPATRLALPEFVGEMSFDPPFLNAALGGTVRFEGSLGEPIWGWADIILLDDSTGELLQTTRARLRSGSFAGEINLPAHSLDGKVNGLALAYNPARGYARMLRGSFSMAEPKLRWEEPLKIHEVEVDSPLSALSFPLTVTNPLPVEVEKAIVRISRSGIDRPIFERRFRFEPGESKPVGFRWVAAPGAYAVRVDLETGDHPSQKISHGLTLLAFNPAEPADYVVSEATLDFRPKVMSPGRLPSASVALFNAGGQTLDDGSRPGRLAVRLVEADTGEPISHDYFFEPPAGGRFADLRLVAKKPVERYKTPIALSVLTEDLQREVKRLPLPIEWARGADLSVAPRSVRFRSEGYREGQTIFIEGVVENVGDLASEPTEATAYLDEPWNSKAELSSFVRRPRTKLEALAPGEARAFSVRWDSFGKRGEQEVYLVVNPRKDSFEQTFANNAARAYVDIKPHADFSFRGAPEASPLVAADGREITVRATVRNSSDQAAEGLEVEARLLNQLDGSVPVASEVVSLDLGPNASGEVEFKLAADRRHNLVEIEANPKRRLFERDDTNNLATVRLFGPLRAGDLAERPDGSLSWHSAARLGSGSDVQVRPDSAIAPSIAALYASSYVVFSPEQLERYARPESEGLPPESDNLWTVRSGLLEAGPRENAEILRLAVPAKTGRRGLHAVRVRVERRANRDGAPSTRFRARAEREDGFKDYDFAPGRRERDSRDAFVELGVFDLEDGVFDIEIDDVAGAWSVIRGFEFAPALSEYEAPPLETAGLAERFGADARLRLRASADIPRGSSIRFQRRFGQEDGRGNVRWGEWADDPGLAERAGLGEAFSLSEAGDLIAWRAELRRTYENHPVVLDMRIERENP